MKLNILISIILFTYFYSSNAQNISQHTTEDTKPNLNDLEKVKLVKQLGNNITLVYQDKKNNYWFGSWEDGLYKYDGQSILHFTMENGLPSNRVEEIKEDNFGNIFISTSNGIIKTDGEKFQIMKVSKLDNDWKLQANDLWFRDGWNSRNIFRSDGNNLYRLELPKTELGEKYISQYPNHPNPYTVYSIYEDSQGSIWFGTAGLGAFRYDGKSFDWILERDVVEIFNTASEGVNGVRSIIEDKDGYFWFNSDYRYKVYDDNKPIKNSSDDTFYVREKSIGSLDGKLDGILNEYLSIAKDKNEGLWFATYKSGVYHYNGKDIKNYIVKNKSEKVSLFTVYRDKTGNLWLGTHEAGAYKFNGQTFKRFKL